MEVFVAFSSFEIVSKRINNSGINYPAFEVIFSILLWWATIAGDTHWSAVAN
jgi:hypothetical protein